MTRGLTQCGVNEYGGYLNVGYVVARDTDCLALTESVVLGTLGE